MKNFIVPIIGAVITALLSTLCCLPAFLFLFFGVSGGILTYFTTLEYTRIPLAILSVVFFLWGIKNLNKKVTCKCTRKNITTNVLIFSAILILLFALLFYPELISYVMD
ncbi:hypothetical protein [Halarcobacter sp.]|uniref:hypothetical protein n=1 Tax=Halarcobacter sp. TaxID=2321133 RepID=UPI0029F57D23|nr:hypothetical protein [Halarcobacter sp.]